MKRAQQNKAYQKSKSKKAAGILNKVILLLLFFCALFCYGKRKDVLPPNLMKSRSCEIWCYNDRVALKFDRHLGISASRDPVVWQPTA